MAQTPESKKALARDDNLCQWHFHKLNQQRDVHYYSGNHHPLSGGAHHILGRAKVDDSRAILGLCGECHTNHHNGKSPSKWELAELILEVYGYNLWKLWPMYIKPRMG